MGLYYMQCLSNAVKQNNIYSSKNRTNCYLRQQHQHSPTTWTTCPAGEDTSTWPAVDQSSCSQYHCGPDAPSSAVWSPLYNTSSILNALQLDARQTDWLTVWQTDWNEQQSMGKHGISQTLLLKTRKPSSRWQTHATRCNVIVAP